MSKFDNTTYVVMVPKYHNHQDPRNMENLVILHKIGRVSNPESTSKS